jgi:hypothetical protein
MIYRFMWCVIFHRRYWTYHREHDQVYGYWCQKCLLHFRAMHDPDEQGRCLDCGERVPFPSE